MREIPLGGEKGAGLVALIDDQDFEMVSCRKWHCHFSANGVYAQSTWYNGQNLCVSLHRFILGLSNPKIQVDHIDHNGLNCTRDNLRTCSIAQNQFNRLPYNRGSSNYKGVSWRGKREKWRAIIKFNRKPIELGQFDSEIDAARAYDEAARKLFGEFAYLNFP